MDEPVIETVERGGDAIALHVHPAPADAPTLAVLWPAMGVPARYYRKFAAELSAAGVAVVVADLRGTGASLPRPSRASTYGLGDLVGDIDAVLEHLKPRRAGRRTILVGHSLGGQACALHLATEHAANATGNATGNAADTSGRAAGANGGGSDVAGLVLLAVGLPYWRNHPGRRRQLAVLAQTQVLGVASAVLRVWPGWGFGGRQARGVIRDWAHSARTGRYPRLSGVSVEGGGSAKNGSIKGGSIEGGGAKNGSIEGVSIEGRGAKDGSIKGGGVVGGDGTKDGSVGGGGLVDVEAGLGLVTTPVLAVDMDGDRYTPPGTVSRLLDKLSGAPVTRERYAPGPAIDHFRWAKHGGELASRIAAWARGL